MRNQFDPLAQLHHQNLHHPDPSHGNQQMQEGQLFHQHRPSKPANLFGNGFSTNTSGFSHDSVGEKRTNSDENIDCNLLQSSMKRVRLSRSPGEFRLQRDLKTLDPMQWGSSHVAANALNYSNTTWIHRSTGTRLTMVDSLRICLFLPVTAMQSSGQPTSDSGIDPEQQYQHQLHSYHRDYRWRIMIQIPRMYPHTPPAVTQIDGLALDSIVINEKPPDAHFRPSAGLMNRRRNENDGASSVHSTQGVASSGSLFFTETQLARSQSSRTSMASTDTTHGSSPGFMPGKTIEWNDWSPITGLGELLDFLLEAAASSLSTITGTGAGTATNGMMGTRHDFQTSMAVTTAKSTSSSSLSSVSSSSSLSSWGNRNIAIHDRSLFQRGSNNTVAETSMMTDENATTSSEVSGAFFLSPNRFDMGYGKSHSITPGATPRTTNTTAWQQHMQGRGEDDVGMDMS